MELKKVKSSEIIDEIYSSTKSDIGFSELEVVDDLYLTTSRSMILKFRKCVFPNIYLENVELVDNLTLSDCTIDSIEVHDSKSFLIKLINTQVRNKIYIGSSSGDLFFSSVKGKSNLELTGIRERLNLKVNTSFFNSLTLNNILSKDSKFNFESTSIQILRFLGDFDGNFNTYQLNNIKNLTFEKFRSNASQFPCIVLDKINIGNLPEKLSFIDLNLKDALEIKNSDLSEMKLHVSDADISSLKYFNTKFPETVSSLTGDLFQVKEIFRQLKKVAEHNNDRIESRNYGAAELEAYWNYLKTQKGTWWKRLPLLLSKLTNDFGRSWIKPLGWLGATSAIFYFGIGIVQSYDLESFLGYVLSGYFFPFILPVHDLDYISNPNIVKLYSLIIVIDFFQRIFDLSTDPGI